MNLFVYIGFPKTGNTSLHYFFLKSKRVNYLIESSTERKLTKEFDFIWKSIIFDNLKTFKLKIKNNRDKIISSLSKDKNNIVLIEGMTDIFFYFRRESDFLKRLNILARAINDKVKVKVLLTLRRQDDFILSRYIETPEFFPYISKSWINLQNIVEFYKYKSKDNKFLLKFKNHLKYTILLQKLIKLFEKKNVNIFFFEELKYETKLFSKKLSKILNLEYKDTYAFFREFRLNDSLKSDDIGSITKKKQLSYAITNNLIYKYLGKYINLRLKYLLKSGVRKIDYLFSYLLIILKIKKKTILKNNERKIILNYYRNDNKNLSKFLNLNLRKWGYY